MDETENTTLVTGRVLFTKDGRRIGNAVVLSAVPHGGIGEVYEIRTDFGTSATLTGAEIRGMFHLGPVCKLDRRARDQADLLAGRTPDFDPEDYLSEAA